MTKQFRRKKIAFMVNYYGCDPYEVEAWQVTPNFAAVKCLDGYTVHHITTGDTRVTALDGDTLEEVTARCRIMEELVPCDRADTIVPALVAEGIRCNGDLRALIDAKLKIVGTYSN